MRSFKFHSYIDVVLTILNRYESITWIPNAITFITILAVGGKNINPSTLPTFPTPTPATVISCATFLASSVLSWCTMTPDYGVYHNGQVPTYVNLSSLDRGGDLFFETKSINFKGSGSSLIPTSGFSVLV